MIEPTDIALIVIVRKMLNEYAGNIPLHYRKASELEGINLVTPTWATPTILFIQDGKEVFDIRDISIKRLL